MDLRKAVVEFNLGWLQGISVLNLLGGIVFFGWASLAGLDVIDDGGEPWGAILIGSLVLMAIGAGGLRLYRFASQKEKRLDEERA